MSKSKVHVYRGGEKSKFIEMLHHRSHFSKTEVEKLLMLMKQLVSTTGNRVRMDRNRFTDFLHNSFHFLDETLTDRVFKAFDTDNDGYISEMEWIMGLSICLRGTIEEKMKFCFSVYDMNADGYISREEMFQLLKNCILKPATEEDPDEGIKDLVEIVLKKMLYGGIQFLLVEERTRLHCTWEETTNLPQMYLWSSIKVQVPVTIQKLLRLEINQDRDHDSRVSFEDWRASIMEESLLLEAFGQCLPCISAKDEFLDLICDNAYDAGMSISAQRKRKGTGKVMSKEQVAH